MPPLPLNHPSQFFKLPAPAEELMEFPMPSALHLEAVGHLCLTG